MKTFFIADPHFRHRAIIEYENCPFITVLEMDNALIGNWNRVVRKRDKIYLLGDVSFIRMTNDAKRGQSKDLSLHKTGERASCPKCLRKRSKD